MGQGTAIAVSVRTYKVRWTLTKTGEYRLIVSKASAHCCAIGIFLHIGQLVIVFAVLCDTLLSDSYRPLFIEWQRQASYVLFLINFFVNVSWYPKP